MGDQNLRTEGRAMIQLEDGADFALLFTLAAIFGAIGGFVYDLLQTRSGGDTGAIELPTALSSRYHDWGVFASVIVGAVAAVAAIWLFPPLERVTTSAEGITSTVKEYGYDRLIPLSLIIGSAGSSFLTAFQAKALALVKKAEADQTRAVAEAELNAVVEEARSKGKISTDDLAARVESAKQTLAATAPAE